MNAQTLYEELKRAIKYFGLSFHQMDQVQVAINQDEIIFSHGRMSITIPFE